MSNLDYRYLFGPESTGSTLEGRARTSTYEFVRSQDHLSYAKPAATGRRLTALEALQAFGVQVLQDVVEYGSAILPVTEAEPARTLRKRRMALGLSVQEVARAAKLLAGEVEDCENCGTRSPIRQLEQVAVVLGLDERLISWEAGAGGNDGLAVRLKQLGGSSRRLTPAATTTLAEAAWVIRTQVRLRQLLNIAESPYSFEPSSMYGDSEYPTWRHGYYLAAEARKQLGIALETKVILRSILESLQVPIVYATLPRHLAGATVVSGGVRGIVVNTVGHNTNVWVRRATIAHELGHLLWDPDDCLDEIIVDEYDTLKPTDRGGHSRVEARANAFAMAFLAPLEAVAKEFKKYTDISAGLRAVMVQFGISYTAASYHICHAVDGVEHKDLTVPDYEPTQEWQALEAYTDDFFPIEGTSQLRKGRFAGLVVAAERRKLVSVDTACTYLQTTARLYSDAADAITDLLPV